MGLYWNTKKDVFEFKAKIVLKFKSKKDPVKTYSTKQDLSKDVIANLTRRQVLSQVNSIYDPLGLATPFIVKAKILMRKTWSSEKTCN